MACSPASSQGIAVVRRAAAGARGHSPAASLPPERDQRLAPAIPVDVRPPLTVSVDGRRPPLSIEGDGTGDVAVGAPGDLVNGAVSGAVYVFPGSASGLGTGIRLTRPSPRRYGW